MNLPEFSNQFDVLVSSYRRFRDFDDREPLDTIEFNEYEKSLYLTKSQETLAMDLYSGRNIVGASFEETEELRRYLAGIVKEARLSPITNTSGILGVDSKSKFFTLPDDLWFITYESVTVSDGKCGEDSSMEVVPVRQDEYHRLKKNPFRGANNRRSLRLDLSDWVVEIVSKFTVTAYYLRYLRKISPIVLEDMPNGLTINGVGTQSECELHESLHQRILERAVILALQSKGYTRENNNRE
jgi:hypothetical protein